MSKYATDTRMPVDHQRMPSDVLLETYPALRKALGTHAEQNWEDSDGWSDRDTWGDTGWSESTE